MGKPTSSHCTIPLDKTFLLIYATFFVPEPAKAYSKTITLRRIPQILLSKYTFSAESCNLSIIDPPNTEDKEKKAGDANVRA